MRIGELSERTGVSPRSLRYYEQQGLLRPHRQDNGYREYDEDAVAAVSTVQGLLAAGLSTEIIRDVLPCTQGKAPPRAMCPDLVNRVSAVRDELDHKAKRIAEHATALDRYLAGTDGSVPAVGMRMPGTIDRVDDVAASLRVVD